MPTFNRRERLLKTLLTIRHQTYENLEILVSDDGSNDGSADAVRALHDPRIRVVGDGQNGGVARARNLGIASATGKWISFCDDDDYWVREKVERQVDAMRQSQRRWSLSSAVNVDEDFGYVHHNEWSPGANAHLELWRRNRVSGGCSNVIVERSLLEDVGGFDETFRVFADWELWLRLALAGPPATVRSHDVLYVIHQSQMTSSTDGLFEEFLDLRRKHQQSFPALWRDPMLKWVGGRARENRDWRMGLRILRYSPLDVTRAFPDGWELLKGVYSDGDPSAPCSRAIADVRATLTI